MYYPVHTWAIKPLLEMDQPSAVQQHCPLYSILAPLSFKCTLRQIWPWPTFYCILSKADTVLLSIISLVLTSSELCGNSSQSRLLSVFFLMPLLSHWTCSKVPMNSHLISFVYTQTRKRVSLISKPEKKKFKKKKRLSALLRRPRRVKQSRS